MGCFGPAERRDPVAEVIRQARVDYTRWREPSGNLSAGALMRPMLAHADLRRLLEASTRTQAALPPSTDRDSWDAARQRRGVARAEEMLVQQHGDRLDQVE